MIALPSDEPTAEGGSRAPDFDIDIELSEKEPLDEEEQGTINILALVETFVATAVLAWFSLNFGTRHLVISACIAPLLLLRTPDSQRLGLEWGVRSSDWLFCQAEKVTNLLVESRDKLALIFMDLPAAILVFILASLVTISSFAANAVLILCVRAMATLVVCCIRPFKSIKAIPNNWWRNVSYVNFWHAPEPLPGIIKAIDQPKFSGYKNAYILHPMRSLQQNKEIGKDTDEIGLLMLARLVSDAPIYIFVSLPAILYRWSLKSTSLLYSPLVWIAHQSFADNPMERLNDVCSIEFYRWVRTYSRMVLCLLVIRLLADILIPSWPSLWADVPYAQLLNAVIAPHAAPLWQIAMGINAILAWILYFYADWVLKRQKRGSAPSERKIDIILRALWLVRTSLSVYVILNGIRAAAVLAGFL